MRNARRSARLETAVALLGLVAPLGGCASRGAPSLILFGAYFPGWMLCGLFGILAAIGTRAAMVLSGLSDVLPFQLFVCVSAGFFFAALAWLFWFGR
ncbi:MAG: hypothetical protein WDN01_02035 [Rhizomicrobium sp.]